MERRALFDAKLSYGDLWEGSVEMDEHNEWH